MSVNVNMIPMGKPGRTTRRFSLRPFRSAGIAVVSLTLAMLAPPIKAQSSTPHDLLASGNREGRETCVFCHAPASGSSAKQEPLWNTVSASSVSFDAPRPLGPDTGNSDPGPGSSSVLCISCHDGVQASEVSASPSSSQGDHPVGMPYGGPRSPLSDDPHSAPSWDAVSFREPDSGIIDGRRVYWVDVNRQRGRQKADLHIPTREDKRPYVECATCHDPHGAGNRLFLRVRSQDICLSCHTL